MRGITWGRVIPPAHKKVEVGVVVASGSSLAGFDFDILKKIENSFIVTVNGSGDSVPFADAWFTLDPWGLHGPQLPKQFKGKMYAAVPDDFGTPAARCPKHRVSIRANVTFLHRLQSHNLVDVSSDSAYVEGLSEDNSCINTGNSGYGALNLLYHLRPKKIILLGVDAGNGYFYPSSKTNRALTNLPLLFKSAQRQLEREGISVVNGSQLSKVSCFPRMSPIDAIAWGCE